MSASARATGNTPRRQKMCLSVYLSPFLLSRAELCDLSILITTREAKEKPFCKEIDGKPFYFALLVELYVFFFFFFSHTQNNVPRVQLNRTEAFFTTDLSDRETVRRSREIFFFLPTGHGATRGKVW